MTLLSSIGEDKLIKNLTSFCPLGENVIVGPGDDCAVLKQEDHDTFTLLKTDTIIEGVHYLPNAEPYWVGWKAVARVVSDFAAMGGKPDSLVIAIAMKDSTPVSYLTNLYQGIEACAKMYHFSVVGGETSSSKTNIITASGIGYTNNYITRSGAHAGNPIYVTGMLGGSLGGKHLTFKPRVLEALWLSKNANLTAMMDLSDGLAKDLPRLAGLSQVGFAIQPKNLPRNSGISIEQALTDGEDYELLFTTESAFTETQLKTWDSLFPDINITEIGSITSQNRTPLSGGWEHFSH